MNTFLESINILGIRVTMSPKGEILDFIRKYLDKSSVVSRQSSEKSKKSLVVVTPNPEQLVYAQKDSHFAKILNEADIALPDGIGLVAAMRFSSRLPTTNYQLPATKRIPGVEFMEELVELAAKHGWPVAFVGGREGVVEEALLRLKKKYPGLIGWVRELPEVSIGDLGNLRTLGDVHDKIIKTNTKLVFVGLGAPKQEYFIEQVKSQKPKVKSPLILMSVGGSFDIVSERTRRAPVFIRSIGLEWLWRLILEPWRWRRQLALLKFLWLVACKKLA